MLGNIGIWQLLIILVIVLLLFGTKRLKGLGGDLGGAIKGFKKAMTDEKNPETDEQKRVEEELNAAPNSESEVTQKTAADAQSDTKQS